MKRAMRARVSVFRVLSVILFPATLAFAAGETSGRVAPGETVEKILHGEKVDVAASAEGMPGAMALFLKVSGWTCLAILSTLALATLYRRSPRAGRAHAGKGEMEILARAALSPKHAVILLRAGSRRIVVGISGERMRPLAVFEAPQNSSSAADREPEMRWDHLSPGTGTGTKTEREVGQSWEPARVRPEDLEPYRRQVDRLRGLLESWRGQWPENGRSKEI